MATESEKRQKQLDEEFDERRQQLDHQRRRRLDAIRQSLSSDDDPDGKTLLHVADGDPDGKTLLHVAVEAMNVDAVRQIIEIPRFDVNAENTSGKTALEVAVDRSLDRATSHADARAFRNIERVLLGHDKVSAFVDRLYRERQVNVDAANAILLGAALIATITFSSWFTLPLPQDTSTNAPSPQVPPTNARAIEVFWVLNSLSFFFSVATVLAAAYATAPIFHHPFIGLVVRIVKRKLVLTCSLFVLSVLCVLGAFTSGAYARLAKDQAKKTKIVIVAPVGIGVCILILIVYVVELKWGTRTTEFVIGLIEIIFSWVGDMIGGLVGGVWKLISCTIWGVWKLISCTIGGVCKLICCTARPSVPPGNPPRGDLERAQPVHTD